MKPERVAAECVEIPRDFYRLHRFVTLVGELMFVKGMLYQLPNLLVFLLPWLLAEDHREEADYQLGVPLCSHTPLNSSMASRMNLSVGLPLGKSTKLKLELVTSRYLRRQKASSATPTPPGM